MKTDTILQTFIVFLILGLILGGCNKAKGEDANPLAGVRPAKLGIKTDKGWAVLTLATGEVKWGADVPSVAVRDVLDQVVLTVADPKTSAVTAEAAGYKQSDAIADWNKIIIAFQDGKKPASGTDEENAILLWKAAKTLFGEGK